MLALSRQGQQIVLSGYPRGYPAYFEPKDPTYYRNQSVSRGSKSLLGAGRASKSCFWGTHVRSMFLRVFFVLALKKVEKRVSGHVTI